MNLWPILLTLNIWPLVWSLVWPILITLAVMGLLLSALSFTMAYRSRRASPTSPYTLARHDAKVAKLGYWSQQHGRRVTPEPPARPPPLPDVPPEDKERGVHDALPFDGKESA